MLDAEIPCPLCKQIINNLATMSLAAQNKAISIIRHTTRCAILVEDFASDGMLSPVLEKEGILGNTRSPS